MRRVQVRRRLDAWVVTLGCTGFGTLAGREFWFDTHAGALEWAVCMVGLGPSMAEIEQKENES